MSRFAIRREGTAWVIIDTHYHRKIDVAASRQEAEHLLRKFKAQYRIE